MLGGAVFTYAQFSFLGRSIRTRGTVVDIVWESIAEDGETSTYGFPVIEFKDPQGSSIIYARGRAGSNPPDFQVGDMVDILYDPTKPQYVQIDTFWDFWEGTIIAFVLGIAFILVSLLVARAPIEQFT